MKKVVTLIFVLVILCMFSTTALAAGEITFRNIPWGSSMVEVEKALDLNFFNRNDEQLMPRCSAYEEIFDYKLNDYPAGWVGGCPAISGELNVAGYDASLHVFCAYGVSSDKKILRDIKDSVFYLGGYTFSAIDYEATYLDLKAKLERLYGNGKEVVEDGTTVYANLDGSGEFHYQTRIVTWNGNNNVQIKLYCKLCDVDDSSLNEDFVVLWYGKTDMDAHLDKLQMLIHQEKLLEEQQNRTDSTDGL